MRKCAIDRREFIRRGVIGSVGLISAKTLLAIDLGKKATTTLGNVTDESTGIGADFLSGGFQNPPAVAKPQAWWHWVNRNVTKEGITADLEALHRIGIGGAQIFNIDYQIPTGSIQYLTNEWLDAMRHAAQEAERLGLELGMHNCSGWSSSGGPWITPEHGMQKVFWTESHVKGPLLFNGKIQKPRVSKYADHYRDIAILACKTPAAESSGAAYRLPEWFLKAGFEVPKDPWVWHFDPGNQAPRDAVYQRCQIFDISTSLKSDGTLSWDAPEGDWTIFRFGHAPNGRPNTHPENPAGFGLEVDKMSRPALDLHFEYLIAAILKDMGPMTGKSFTNLLIDSYEVGPQNWTPQFREEFQRRRGYDLTPYLLALTGRIVDSIEITERFLWDFRRTIADLYHDNYYSYFTELCHQRGLKSAVEPYTGPFSTMDNAAAVDIPMSEFWTGNTFGISAARIRLVASGAHLEGKSIVGAEAFTSGWQNDRFTQHPYALKALGDFQFCDGINRFYFHDFTHQPWVDQAMMPGMTMGPWGLHFARTVTWWEQAGPWMSYLARCQYLLQSGQPVSDILCFTGEGAQAQAVWGNIGNLPTIPEGYDFEFVNAAQLLGATVQDGQIVLPKGHKFRVLALPDARYLTLAVAKKIEELVKGGAILVGPPPSCSPSLSGFPASDATIRGIATDLWGVCDGRTVTENAAGLGKVFWGKPLAEVLRDIGIMPDFAYNSTTIAKICYKHRATEAAEIYFISNQSAQTTAVKCKFRVTEKIPELWNAETGLMELAPVYTEADGCITVPLQLDPSGSIFVVFRQSAEADHGISAMAPSLNSVSQAGASSYQLRFRDGALILNAWVSGDYEIKTNKGRSLQVRVATLPAPLDMDEDWEVSFPPKLGAPASVRLARLKTLSQHEEPGVRYFSGTAVYTKNFNISREMLISNRDVYLDLGDVKNIAQVQINGTTFGILWKPPFRVCVTSALQHGKNRIEVRVTNVWANRLIGDEKLPDDCEWIAVPNRGWRLKEWPPWLVKNKPRPSGRIAFASWRFYDGSETIPDSGLIGPVRLHTVEKVNLTMTASLDSRKRHA